MMYRKLLLAPLFILVVATGCSSDSSNDSGETTGGETTGGETTGGETTGGETTGGETTGGETTGGETTGGETTGGDTTGGDTTGGDTTGGDTTGGLGDTISGNVQFLGILGLTEDTQDSEVSAAGVFIRYTSSIAGNLVAGAFVPNLDTCDVTTIDISDPTDLPDIETDVVPAIVSAGEVIPLTSPAGTYIQLMRQSVAGFTLYVPEPLTVASPMPTSVTANIPGDVFPAFANVAMPTVDSLVVSSPAANEMVTPGTVFTWTAGTNPDAYLDITTTTIDGTGQTTVVDCKATDDGTFAFPASVQAEMGADFMGLFFNVEREVQTIRQQGNAVLILTASSGT